MVHFDNYKVDIDGRWSLEDLYRFPRAYEQVYFALEAIIPSDSNEQEERIERAFLAFPWRGGYSAVNFYDQLKWATPRKRRPAIVSVKYASLGWIELFLNQALAIQIAGTISSVAASIGVCNKVYNGIYRDLQKRKLLRMAVESKKIALVSQRKLLHRSVNNAYNLIQYQFNSEKLLAFSHGHSIESPSRRSRRSRRYLPHPAPQP